MSDTIFSGGGLRVRWHEWAGLRGWMDCDEVSISGDYVVINDLTAGKVIVVPAHRIYGQLEVGIRPKPETETTAVRDETAPNGPVTVYGDEALWGDGL